MSAKLVALSGLITIDFIFGAVIGVALFALARTRRSAYAVMKRNFLAYFTNPTGYVFLCLFVLLTSLAAFWTEGFFNANLANLDQLNYYIPLILLVFIPAISMSIWAEERRQGTDELLLTMPAGDFDVVIGKYLAAVAIFTVSLLFSQMCNFIVLLSLGDPDTGLVLGNYFGYWMVGLAMLAVGMVASFLTSNLTVGFVLGVLFNVPLVAAGWTEVFTNEAIADRIRPWSVSAQLRDFESGVISGASVIFFLLLVVLMIYLAMVLIGRRHWTGGKQGNLMGWHFLSRALALVLIAVGVSVVAREFDWFRPDVTTEKINSLSQDTRTLIKGLDPEYPVHIDAYISKDLPEDYAQRRLDLRSRLRELSALGGKNVTYEIHELDIGSEEAHNAQMRFGIQKAPVMIEVRGAVSQQEIIFGIYCKSGAQQVLTPFLGKGVPIEYELVRSIVTVTETKRPRLGILETEANLMGAFSMSGPTREQPIAAELRKQYELVPVSPNSKIDGNLAALLAVQPSSLSPAQLQNFVDAVKRGIPTAIFEDPFPVAMEGVTGTDQPKRGQGMMDMLRPPQEKGNMQSLWDVIGVQLEAPTRTPNRLDPLNKKKGPAKLVWQDYNPHPGVTGIPPEWVFITPDESNKLFSSRSPISSNLQEVLFLFTGGIVPADLDTARARLNQDGAERFDITELVRTRPNSGTVAVNALFRQSPFGIIPQPPDAVAAARGQPTGKRHVLAAHVRGPAAKDEKPKASEAKGDAEKKEAGTDDKTANKPLDVVLVADVDVLSASFFELRTIGDDNMNPITRWRLDNVAFVLNVIDVLTGETDFVEIRKRRPKHRELKAVLAARESAKEARREARETAEKEVKRAFDKEDEKLTAISEALQKQGASRTDHNTQMRMEMQAARKRVEREEAKANRRRDEKYDDIERAMASNIREVQDRYKLWAVVLPPIPPLLIAICVFFVRRGREREGIHSDRLV